MFQFLKKTKRTLKLKNNKKKATKENVKDFNKNFNEKIITLKLKGTKEIIKISYMFDECESLISLPDISKWNN